MTLSRHKVHSGQIVARRGNAFPREVNPVRNRFVKPFGIAPV
jgi:hypothetical protein